VFGTGCASIEEFTISVTIYCIASNSKDSTAITPVTITNTGSGIYSYSISPAISNGLSQHD
jgi:hypothetical protein